LFLPNDLGYNIFANCIFGHNAALSTSSGGGERIPRLLGFVSPDLGSSSHQRLLPEGGKMTKNEILTENDVQCKQRGKQAKHTIRKASQMPKLATQQYEIEMHDELSTRSSKPAAPPYIPIPRKAPSSKSGPGHSLIFGRALTAH
jgi:hypothetical protein